MINLFVTLLGTVFVQALDSITLVVCSFWGGRLLVLLLCMSCVGDSSFLSRLNEPSLDIGTDVPSVWQEIDLNERAKSNRLQ